MVNAVGIGLTDEKPAALEFVEGRGTHCSFIGRARNSSPFYIESRNINCPLGRFNLGLKCSSVGALAKVLVDWGDAADQECALRYLESAIRLPACPKYIAYFPFPHENLKPDVVVRVAKADEAMGIVLKFASQTGKRIKASISGIGASCGECTAYPLVTGSENISLGCNGTRRRVQLGPDELLLAAPQGSRLMELF